MRGLPIALLGTVIAASGAHASGGGGGASADGLNFVPLDEIRVPIVDSGRVTGALKLKLVLQASDAAAAARIAHAMPDLRARALGATLDFAGTEASGLRAVDAELLDHQLTEALQAGDPGVSRVLIVEVGAENA